MCNQCSYPIYCKFSTSKDASTLSFRGVVNEVMEFFGQRVRTCQGESPWPSMLGAVVLFSICYSIPIVLDALPFCRYLICNVKPTRYTLSLSTPVNFLLVGTRYHRGLPVTWTSKGQADLCL